jgi:hypothetical protein
VVVKTQEDEGLISDLAKTFDNLRKVKMKLNPKKCTFVVPLGGMRGLRRLEEVSNNPTHSGSPRTS